jgi:hypothetical protein
MKRVPILGFLAVVLCVSALPVAALAQSAAPSAVPSPGPNAAVRPMTSDPTPLEPGAYISNVGTGTSVTFDVADDAWTGVGGGMVVMDRDVAGDSGELIATTFLATVADPCDHDLGVPQQEAMDAKAFTDWLVGQPWAVATASPTTLGGEPAIQVEISALESDCPDVSSLFVWRYLNGGPYRLFPTEAVRVIAQDRGEDLILVTAETLHAASLPAFLESAMPVIDSMTFGEPMPIPSPEQTTGADAGY